MYSILQHAHSGLRWAVLILLIITIFKSFTEMSKANREVGIGNEKIFVMNMAIFHLQVIIGLVLFFLSPKAQMIEGFMKETVSRFYIMEHPVMMIIAAVLITIGFSKSKRITESKRKYKTLFIFNLIALIIILAMIPWPFRAGLGGSWF